MNIGSRLKAVAKLVKPTSVLADIGTDHAYLPTYLVEKNIIEKAIASDIAQGPYQQACETISMHGLKNKIEARLGSGLTSLKPGEATCLTICGMGASTSIESFEEAPLVLASAKQLVLQPMNGAASLRKWLGEHGWVIDAELLVDDEPYFYEIISAQQGGIKAYSLKEQILGPKLIEERPALFEKHLKRQINFHKQLLKNMSKSETARSSKKFQELSHVLSILEGVHDDTCNSK